ncbi:DUF308 domain-containing protein [Patescibacteria group bacterium]|nr:DUF308 domain-containing protein [Patescibacteria group bacterium]MBU1673533.1 DUF308 domain-containing protein [Patescibacteria group bacterium]MBU1963717.1 DUF308 domain-containing protein [Patescibacteria group bacterium]
MEDKIKTSSGKMLMFRSMVSIAFGLAFLFWPGPSINTLVVLFSLYAMADGILAMWAALISKKLKQRWPGVFFWEGTLSLTIGVVVGLSYYMWPYMEFGYLQDGVMFWAVITGGIELLNTFSVNWEKRSKIFMGINGCLSIMLAFVLLVYPIYGPFRLGDILGVYAILFGIFMFLHGMDMGGFFKIEKNGNKKE